MPTVKSQPSAFHDQVQKNDDKAKSVMKQSADAKAYVKESDLKVGDKVLLKQPKLNKTTTPYHPQPYVVIARNGSQLVAKNQDHVLERHVNHCKKWQCDSEVDSSRRSSPDDFDMGEGVVMAGVAESQSHCSNTAEAENRETVQEKENSEGSVATESARSLRPRGDLRKPLRFRGSNHSQ